MSAPEPIPAAPGKTAGREPDPLEDLDLVRAISRLPGKAGRRAGDALDWVAEARPRMPVLDVALQALARDFRMAGGVFAGALAFRIFLMLLPLALLFVAGLGMWADSNSGGPPDAAEQIGIKGAIASSIADASHLSNTNRVALIAFAVWLLLLGARTAARTTRIIFAVAWGVPIERWGKSVSGAVVAALTLTVAFAIPAVGSWGRARGDLEGVLLTLIADPVLFFLLWLGVSHWLPPRGVPLRALIPGALVMTIGVQILHVGTVLFFAGRVQRASEVYGTLGVAVALLVWLYLLGRLAVAAAILNATIWERGHGPLSTARPLSADLSDS